MEREKNIAIIFAGGVGQRFGSEIPKQFTKVYGKEIIAHTIEKFNSHPEIDEIYVGCVADWIGYTNDLIVRYGLNKVKSVIPGGTSGPDTIYRLLIEAKRNNGDDSIVLIHDGVRPVITPKEISENIVMAKEFGAAITCEPFVETPILSYDGVIADETFDRRQMFRGVAPQTFKLGHILEAHEKIREFDPNYEGSYIDGTLLTPEEVNRINQSGGRNRGSKIIDSASLVKAAFNETPAMVIGNGDNIKVTTANDFFKLQAIMSTSDILNYFNANPNNGFVPNESYLEAQRLREMSNSTETKVETKEKKKVKVLKLKRDK